MTSSHFQHKRELLESIRQLSKMGYKLYASMGTGDYYKEHGIDVSTKNTLLRFKLSLFYVTTFFNLKMEGKLPEHFS